MKLRFTREQILGAGFILSAGMILTPFLLGEDHKPNTNAGKSSSQHAAPSSSPAHSAPARTSTPPSRGTSGPSGARSNSAPAQTHTNTPSTGSGRTFGNNNPGGGTTTRPNNTGGTPGGSTGQRTYNPAGNGPRNQTPATNQQQNRGNNPTGVQGNNNPGSRGTYNPNNRGTNPTGVQGNNNPGSRGNNNPGSRGTNNPQGNTGGRTFGNNGGNNTGGRNVGNNNPGGRNTGNNNANSGRTFRPPQGAQVSSHQGGGQSYTHGNAHYNTDRNGHLQSYSRPGTQARFRPDGHVSSAHFTRPGGNNVYVNRGPRGERTVVTVRSDHTRIVSYGGRRGYYERPMVGRPGYVSRTYMYGGRPYAHVYRSYSYRGISYYRYVPPYYYHSSFYGWAYNPWATPVVYRWGWFGSPWYGYYGSYFTPAPAYPTAALWLTDYLLAENLRNSYENQQAAQAQAQNAYAQQNYQQQGQVMLTPEIKAAIAEQVRQEIEAERANANQPQGGQPQGGYQQQPQGGYQQPQQGGYQGQSAGNVPTGGDVPPPVLDPKLRIFVVSQNLDVNVMGGEGCSLTPGDIVLRTGDNPTQDGQIGVSVLSAKPGDCAVNSATSLEVAQLQEMHNQFREQIDTGLRTLADNQGKGGLPQGPAAGGRPFADGQAQPESAATVEQALLTQQQDAQSAETEIQQAANGAQ